MHQMKTGIPNLSSSRPITHPQLEALKLPACDGFPYIWTRVVAALYHLVLLPRTYEVKLLQHIAQRQVSANRLPTCLVLGENECYYYTPDGGESRESSIPRGGFVVSGKLQLCVQLEQDDDLHARQRRLFIYEAERNGTTPGCLFGDLTKGGRDATVDEQLHLAGRGQNGVPTGLARCANCGEWAGECLDPSPVFKGKVMRVHCLCENDNRCAACGGLLHARKLNANYFEKSDGQIWHVPGFSGLSHRCPEVCL